MSVLNKSVLKLNSAWQVIGETSVEEALKMMSIDVGTAMYIDGESVYPVKWDEWIKLPVVESDGCIRTQHRNIRRPTVMICVNFNRVPKRRPKANIQNIANRDGYRCQYSGEVLDRSDWSIDHVLPRSRGGGNNPDNLVLASKKINNIKGDRTPQEAGLPVPVIRKLHHSLATASHPHHELFLKSN